MKRYTCTVGDKRGAFGCCMEQDKAGAWMRVSDHERHVKALERQIEALKNNQTRETKK